MDGERCLICLEEGPDALPPCGGVNQPLFHQRCLDMAGYLGGAEKCPHCNQHTQSEPQTGLSVKMDAAQHKTQSIMDRWLQNGGYWVRGPEYIRVNDFLMHRDEANAILGGVCRTVCDRLAPRANYFYTHPPPPDQDTIVLRHRDSEAGVETDVTLRRTAFIHDRRIHTDGFTLSMSRSRYSKRHFRKPVFIEKRRRLF